MDSCIKCGAPGHKHHIVFRSHGGLDNELNYVNQGLGLIWEQHPIIIMESRTVPGRIVLYGDVSSDKGPVMAALELHPTSRGVEIDNMIKVASAYTKNNANNQIKNSDILWVYNNKNKTNDWLRRTRLQLPVGINQYGLIKSVSSAGQQVNNNISSDLNEASQVADVRNLPSLTSENELESTSDENITSGSGDVNSDFSYRGDTRSNREILADALMSATKNASERKSLESYQRVIGALDMQEKLREVKANTEHDIDYIKKRNEERRKRKQMTVLRNNIKNNSGSIISMLKKPTNQRHVPEVIKEPVTRFLASIDFISQQADPGSFNTGVWQDNMNRLHNMLEYSNKVESGDGDVTAYKIEFDPDLIERMERFTRDNDGKELSSMGMKEIEDLYIIVRSLRMGISNANKMFANKRSADAQKIGWGSGTTELKIKYGTPDKFMKEWTARVLREKGLRLFKNTSKEKVLRKIPYNKKVNVLYKKLWYAKVEYMGTVGFVRKKYLG